MQVKGTYVSKFYVKLKNLLEISSFLGLRRVEIGFFCDTETLTQTLRFFIAQIFHPRHAMPVTKTSVGEGEAAKSSQKVLN
jgi:regulator of sirC expression with transglutaminase-like and TPR domain